MFVHEKLIRMYSIPLSKYCYSCRDCNNINSFQKVCALTLLETITAFQRFNILLHSASFVSITLVFSLIYSCLRVLTIYLTIFCKYVTRPKCINTLYYLVQAIQSLFLIGSPVTKKRPQYLTPALYSLT